MLLKKGGKGTFIIPSSLGYGIQGAPPRIPADAILVLNDGIIAESGTHKELLEIELA